MNPAAPVTTYRISGRPYAVPTAARATFGSAPKSAMWQTFRRARWWSAPIRIASGCVPMIRRWRNPPGAGRERRDGAQLARRPARTSSSP